MTGTVVPETIPEAVSIRLVEMAMAANATIMMGVGAAGARGLRLMDETTRTLIDDGAPALAAVGTTRSLTCHAGMVLLFQTCSSFSSRRLTETS